MPPKKKGNDKGKSQEKKKAKAVEDKTFGLKNKNKLKKVQQYVQQVRRQAEDPKKAEAMALKRAAEKAAAERAKKEALLMSQTVIQQKVPFGVDPKSVLCVLFKDGKCPKGDKCKFSHDLNIGRKAAKKDLFTDLRKDKEADKMDSWDNEKLRKVVLSKHGNPRTTTDKICKYFLEAVENGTYGWFWVCPNGGDTCKYRHALPEGYVLKTKEQRRLEQLAADAAPKITLEEFIEMEREKLNKNLTPITPETFAKWKAQHIKKKEDKNKGPKKPTGREIIQAKYGDELKGSKVEEEDNGEHGTAWDFSEFQKQMREADKGENIKDYGDGTAMTFEEAKKQQEEKKEEKKEEKETDAEAVAGKAEDSNETVVVKKEVSA